MRSIILQVQEEYNKAFWYSRILFHTAMQLSLLLFILSGLLYAVWCYDVGALQTLRYARFVLQAIPACAFSLIFVAVIGDLDYRSKKNELPKR